MTNEYNTKKFTDFFQTKEEFYSAYVDSGFPTLLKENNIKVLFLLLYQRYGNNPISNMDQNQFKTKLFGIIWQYGPYWEKRLEIQEKLRSLTDDEIAQGNRDIHNHAFNPSSEPSTGTLDELDYINEQTVTGSKRGILEGYNMLLMLLKDDVTSEFLNKFRILFKQIVFPENPLLYETEEEGDE